MEVGEERTARQSGQVFFRGFFRYSYLFLFLFLYLSMGKVRHSLPSLHTVYVLAPPLSLMPGKSEEACSPALTSHQMYKEAAFILEQGLMG
jgi:hypothetical protein